MYQVYDNVVPIELVEHIHSQIDSDLFPWFRSSQGFYTTKINPNDPNLTKYGKNKIIASSQLVHQFIHNQDENGDRKNVHSPLHDLIVNFLQISINGVYQDWNIKSVEILRSKANIMLFNGKKLNKYQHNPPHIDTPIDHLVFLYYVNDSDGDTVIFDLEDRYKEIARISPKKGRLLVFNGNHFHASTPPSNHPSRIVINSNIYLP